MLRAEGYTFVFNSSTNEYVKSPERRTRIFSVSDAANIVNVIRQDVDIAALGYRVVDRRLMVTDEAGFTLDINEFGPNA